MPKYSGAPQIINDGTWFYDNRKGLLVVHEIRDQGVYIRTDQIVIPWRLVTAAVQRHEAPAPKPRRDRRPTR